MRLAGIERFIGGKTHRLNEETDMIDSHVHLRWPNDIENLNMLRESIKAQAMCIVSVIGRDDINDNPALFAAKAAFPNSIYIFPALNHAGSFSGGKVKPAPLDQQIDELVAVGADGLKMIESKPTHRKLVDIPVDDTYYEKMFTKMEEIGLPITWHVADPEEFWYPEKTPSWASGRGWGYDQSWPSKESFYIEVDSVLRQHPKLKVMLSHFYFLSSDLESAAALLDSYEGVCLDLAPGIEMLYNMSRNPDIARDFFIKYSHRIVFGTDIEAGATEQEAIIRAGIVTRWLETEDEYRVPPDADYTLGPPEDGVIRGMRLPDGCLENIYSLNFERIVGNRPNKLNMEFAGKLARLQAEQIQAYDGDPEAALESARRLETGV